jgi:hypothetical protein
MKYRAYFITAGVALAAILVTIAAAAFHGGRLSPHLGEVTANQVAHQTSAGNAYRVYCSNGIKGDQEHLYRGWVCVPENSAAAAH